MKTLYYKHEKKNDCCKRKLKITNWEQLTKFSQQNVNNNYLLLVIKKQ